MLTKSSLVLATLTGWHVDVSFNYRVDSRP
jgi:hypothetical protein